MTKALYPYTLKPVALNMSEAEFRAAQLSLFEKSASNFSLKSLKTTEWIVLAVVVVAAIAGLVLVNGYSTILFWLMLILSALYLVARTLGLKWYMKREYEKQVLGTQMPEQMQQLQLGVQSHGLVMAMPAPSEMLNAPQMRGMQMRAGATQSASIPWSAVSSWDETDKFVFVMFELKGQKGSQIIPKRLENQGLPIDTIKKHLSEIKPQGLESMVQMP
ncbi:YcxB family protein [Moraxella sp. ZJ142]|uniref:YcxB family protein n=1 Tax=Moraxella marmotae TaxID=3344520 RepID=UPI0035D4E10A